MEVCAAFKSVNRDTFYVCLVLTISMTVMLDSNAQDPKAMVSDCIVLDPCLVLEDVIHWFGEKADESVSLRSRNKDTTKLEP